MISEISTKTVFDIYGAMSRDFVIYFASHSDIIPKKFEKDTMNAQVRMDEFNLWVVEDI